MYLSIYIYLSLSIYRTCALDGADSVCARDHGCTRSRGTTPECVVGPSKENGSKGPAPCREDVDRLRSAPLGRRGASRSDEPLSPNLQFVCVRVRVRVSVCGRECVCV